MLALSREGPKAELLEKPPPRVPLPDLIARITWDRLNPDSKDLEDLDQEVGEKAQEFGKSVEENEDLGGGPYTQDERDEALRVAATNLHAPAVRVLLKKGASAFHCGWEIDEKDKNKKAEEQKKKPREHPLLAGLNTVKDCGGNSVVTYKLILQDYLRVMGNRILDDSVRTRRSHRTLVMSMIAKDQTDLALWYLKGCEMSPPLKNFPPDFQFGVGDKSQSDIDGKNLLMYVYENEPSRLRDFIRVIKDERVRTAIINEQAVSQKEDSKGETLLMKATMNGNCRIVRLLLKYKADPAIQNKNGETAAFYAIRGSQPGLLKYFFTRNGARRTSPAYTSFDSDEEDDEPEDDRLEHSEDDDDTVHKIMQEQRQQQALAQQDRGRQYQPALLPTVQHTMNQKYQNLLHVAAQTGSTTAVEKLITSYHFHDMIDAPDADQRTPLIYAAMNGNEGVVKTLLEPPTISQKPVDPRTGQELRGAKEIQVPKWNPANKYLQDKFKKVALQYALEREDDEVTSLLIGRSTDTSARAAVSDEVRDVLRRTIYEGGVTPLMRFVGKNSVMVDVLLQSGVDPNARDSRKRTAMHYLATHATSDETNFKESLRQVLLYEANIDPQDALGRTPLHLATKHFYDSSYDDNAVTLARTLAGQKSALFDTEDQYGRLPLSYAAIYGFGEKSYQEVFADMANGIKISQVLKDDCDGMNPLLWAALGGREQAADMADVALREGRGRDDFAKKVKYVENLSTFQPREKFGVIEVIARKKGIKLDKIVRSRCARMIDPNEGDPSNNPRNDGRIHAAVLFALHFGRLAENPEDAHKEEYQAAKMEALTLTVGLLDELVEDGVSADDVTHIIKRPVIVDLAHKKRAIQERLQREAAIEREEEKHKKAVEEYLPALNRAIREPRHGMVQYIFGPAFTKEDQARLFAGAHEQPGAPRQLVFDDLTCIPSRERKEGTLAQFKVAYVYSQFQNEEGFLCGHQTIWKLPGSSNKSGTWTGSGAQRGADKYFPSSDTEYDERKDPIVGLRLFYDSLPQNECRANEPTRALCAIQVFRQSNQASAVEPLGRTSVLQNRGGGLVNQVQSADIRIPPDQEVLGFVGLAGATSVGWLYDFGVIVRPRGPAFQQALQLMVKDHPPPAKHQLPKPDDVKETNPTLRTVIEMVEEIGPDAGKVIAHPRVTEELQRIWRGETQPDETIAELAFVKPFRSFFDSWKPERAADEGLFAYAFGRPFHKDHGWFRETDSRAAGWNLFARNDMFFGTPRGKFFMEFAFYILFLATFTFALNWQTPQLNVADVLLAFLLVGFVVSESSQAIQEGLKYFTSIWNFADVLMVLIFAAYYFFRVKNIFAFNHTEVTTAYRILAFNGILLWTRLLNVCDLHEKLGPLLTVIRGMASDTLTFLVVLLLVMLGFSQLIHILIIHILEENEQTPQDTVLFMFKTILGDSDIDFVIEKSSMVGFAIYAFYLVFSVIMLLNLLIALYGGTYGEIIESAQEQFQYTRAATYLEYAGREYVPPPFNLIQFLVRVLFEWPLRFLDKCLCGKREDPDSPSSPLMPTAFGRAIDGLGTKVSSLVFLLMILPFALVLSVPFMIYYIINGWAEDASAIVAASENAAAQAATAPKPAAAAKAPRDAAAAAAQAQAEAELAAQKRARRGPLTVALARGLVSVNDGLRAVLGKRDASSLAGTEQIPAFAKSSDEDEAQKMFDLELWDGERKEDQEGAVAQVKTLGTSVDLISQRLQDIEQRVELSSMLLTHVASGKGGPIDLSGAGGAGMMDELKRTMAQLTKSMQPSSSQRMLAQSSPPPPPPGPPRSTGAEVGSAAQTAAARVSVDIQRRLQDMEENLARRMEHIVDQRLAGGSPFPSSGRTGSAPYPSVAGAGVPPASGEELAAQMRAMNTSMQEVREYIQKKKRRSWFG